jgi:hypothetical protein
MSKLSTGMTEERKREREPMYGRFACSPQNLGLGKRRGEAARVKHSRALDINRWKDPDMTDPERRVLMEIVWNANSDYRCFPNLETIKSELGYGSINTVRTALKRLAEKKILLIMPNWKSRSKTYDKSKHMYVFLFHPIFDNSIMTNADVREYLYGIPKLDAEPEDKKRVVNRTGITVVVDNTPKTEEQNKTDDDLLAELDAL